MAELIFDKYEIQSRLAVGGMGEVFYALQRGVKGFERPVILKSLLPDLAQQEGSVEQFLDEARVAATLNHPNVVSIYEVGQWNGQYFIAMEYIHGRNVAQMIKASLRQGKPVPPEVTAKVIRDAALGLDHAHHAHDTEGRPLEVVHRDISPQNIMVRDDGVTKVVDFGIARATNRATRTATGVVKGKLIYMAPEQLAGEPIGGRSDQFSLGIVLWEMLCGRRLFKSDQDLEVIKQVLSAQIPRPSEISPGVPAALDEIAMRMLERDPERRFATCAEAAQKLDLFLQGHPGATTTFVAEYLKSLGPTEVRTPSNPNNFVISLKSPSTSAETVAFGTTSRRWVLPTALAALVALGGLASVLYLRRAEVQTTPVVAPTVLVEPPQEPPRPPPPVAEVAPRVASLHVESQPAGATVRLDGEARGSTPVDLEVTASKPHHLTVEKAGFRVDQRDLEAIEPGAHQELSLKLSSLKAAPIPVANPAPRPAPVAANGTLTLQTAP